jgi:RNA polymerase sigma factor (sigma-70 family)
MAADQMSMLIQRAADGDRVAWNTIVEDYSALLWSVVRRFRLRDAQAADAVQVTWLRLVEHIHAIRDPKRLAGWLRVTAERVCIDTIREAGREYPVDEHHEDANVRLGRVADPAEEAPEACALRREREVLVRQAMDRLPDRQRELLTLLVASPPLGYEQIASRLGMPIGSIGPTRARILQRLRSDLATADFHDLALG